MRAALFPRASLLLALASLSASCGAEAPPPPADPRVARAPSPPPEPAPPPAPPPEPRPPVPIVVRDRTPFGPVEGGERCDLPMRAATLSGRRVPLDHQRWDLDGDGEREEVHLWSVRDGHARELFLQLGEQVVFYRRGYYHLEQERIQAQIDVDPGDEARELMLSSGALVSVREGQLVHAGRWARPHRPDGAREEGPEAPLVVLSHREGAVTLLVRIGERELRARWPSFSCRRARPTVQALTPVEGRRRWLIGAGRTRLVVVDGEEALTMAGPFLDVDAFRPDLREDRATPPDPSIPATELVVEHWRCGRRAIETLRWDGEGYRRASLEMRGTEREVLCDAWFSMEADLDGDGQPERIVAAPAGIGIGDQLRRFGQTAGPENLWERDPRPTGSISLEGEQPSEVEVVDIDERDRHREVRLTFSFEEDVTLTFLLFYRGGRIEVSPPLWSRAQLLGRGRVRTSSGNCGHAVHHEYRLRRGRLVHRRRWVTGRFREEECAACPAVYALGGGGATRRLGEILRQLRGPDAEAWQLLHLPPGRLERVTPLDLRITEEKQEITELDAIHLDVGGEILRPASCAEADHAYCVADGVRHRLAPGESLDLRFELPSTLPEGAPVIVARGFYRPLPRPESEPDAVSAR